MARPADQGLSDGFHPARPRDEAALRRLLREVAVPGPPDLAYEREPRFFAPDGLLGSRALHLAGWSGGRLGGLISGERRPAWVNGKPGQLGWLCHWRFEPGLEGGGVRIRQGEALLARWAAKERLPFLALTLMGGSGRMQRFVEGKARAGRGRLLARLQTLALGRRRRSKALPSARILREAELPAWWRGYAEQAPAFQFAWRPTLAGRPHGLGQAVGLWQGGQLIAGAWVHAREGCQIRVRALPWAWRWGRPLINAWSGRSGWPPLPAGGDEICTRYLSLCWHRPGEARAALDLAEACAAGALPGLEAEAEARPSLSFTLAEGQERWDAAKGLPALRVASDLSVIRAGAAPLPAFDGRPAQIEAAFL